MCRVTLYESLDDGGGFSICRAYASLDYENVSSNTEIRSNRHEHLLTQVICGHGMASYRITRGAWCKPPLEKACCTGIEMGNGTVL